MYMIVKYYIKNMMKVIIINIDAQDGIIIESFFIGNSVFFMF